MAQIILWNYRKSNKKVNGGQLTRRRHAKTHETPMMIYIPLKIYSVTRSRNLIDMLFNLSFCISYDRILEITKSIYENLCESYENKKFFFPNIFKMGLLTVMLKDNIDLNSKSNFIQWYYHEEDDSNLDLHHEDSAKFSSDVKTLCKSMTINVFSNKVDDYNQLTCNF